MAVEVDVRDILPVIVSPTLVLRRGDRAVWVHGARWMAARIPGARHVELEGSDHFRWIGDHGAVLEEIEEFLAGVRGAAVPDRVLLTVLFTTSWISTRHATEQGDQAWRELLDRHDQLVRSHLERFQGREVSTAGDGFVAVFDGPARAVRCAQAIAAAVPFDGTRNRAGLHTGEVLASRTVKDLVAGSGLVFEDRGTHELKGVPDSWQVYAART